MKKNDARGKDTEHTLQLYIDAIERIHITKKELITRSLLTGLFTAIGATVGLSLFAAIITFLLQILGVLPFIGDYFEYLKVQQLLRVK